MTAVHRHGADYFEITSFIGGSKDKKVYNVRHKDTRELLEMHVIPKKDVQQQQQCNPLLVATTFKIPFMVNLRYTFETKSRSYILLDAVKDERRLSRFHKAHGKFEVDEVTFIVTEILLAISQLHSFCAIYGMIDLEHVHLDVTGHVRLHRKLSDTRHWLRNECIRCKAIGTCSYHKEATIEQEAVAKDWIDLAKLMCLMFGSNFDKETGVLGNRADRSSLPENAAKLLSILSSWKQAPFTASQIEGHEFFKKVDWQRAHKRQLTPPEVFIPTPISRASNSDEIPRSSADAASKNPKLHGDGNSHYHESSAIVHNRSAYDQSSNGGSSLRFSKLGVNSDDYQTICHQNALSLEGQSFVQEEGKQTSKFEQSPFSERLRVGNRTLLAGSAYPSDNLPLEASRLRHNFSKQHTDERILLNDFEKQSSDGYDDRRECDKPKRCESTYYPDDVKFVTVDSLEKSFREKSQRKSQHAVAHEKNPSEMTYRDYSARLQDVPDTRSDFSRYSADFLPSGREQPLFSSLCSPFASGFPSKSRYAIKSYTEIPSEDLTQNKPMHYDNISEAITNSAAFQSGYQDNKYRSGEENMGDYAFDGNSSLPAFTRSNSYHGGFSLSGLDKNETNSSAVGRASELLNCDKWKSTCKDDGFRLGTSYAQSVEKSFYSDLTRSTDFNANNESNEFCCSSLSKKTNRSSTNMSSLPTSLQSMESVYDNAIGDTNVQNEAGKRVLQSLSFHEDDKFVKDYLHKTFPVDGKIDNENDVLKMTWPVGHVPSRTNAPSTEIGRRSLSLIHRIVDHDALQRIRQGAYLQGRKDFHMATKRNLSATKSGSVDTSSHPFIHNSMRESTSKFDERSFSTPVEQLPSWGDDTATGSLREHANTSTSMSDANASAGMSATYQKDYWIMSNNQETFNTRNSPGYDVKGSAINGERKISASPIDFSRQSTFITHSMVPNLSQEPSHSQVQSEFLGKKIDTLPGKETTLHVDKNDFNREIREDKWISGNNQIPSSQNLANVDDVTIESNQKTKKAVTEDAIQAENTNGDVLLENNPYSKTCDEEVSVNEKRDQKATKTKQKREPQGSGTRPRKNTSMDGEGAGRQENQKTNAQKQRPRKFQSTDNITVERAKQSRGKIRNADDNAKNARRRARGRNSVHKSRHADNESSERVLDEEIDKNRDGRNTRRVVREDSEEENTKSNQSLTADSRQEGNGRSCEKQSDAIGVEESVSKSSKKNNRSVSFHETTKTPDGSARFPATRKTQSAGAIDSQRLQLSLGKTMKGKDLKFEILPNPKSHRNNHRRLRSVEDDATSKKKEDVDQNKRKASLDSNISHYTSEFVGVTDLVDRLRVISESSRSVRSSPNMDRRSFRSSSIGDGRRKMSTEAETDCARNIVKPKITVQNSTPRSTSPDWEEKDCVIAGSDGCSVSRESSIGSASDLWLDEEEVKNFGKRGASCRRSASTASAMSAESVRYFRAKYSISPTVTSNSSEDDLNGKEQDKQSYASGKSIDSGLSDIFETSKEDDFPLSASRGRSNAVSKSDSGVMNDINERLRSQSDDVFEERDQRNRGSETLCPHCNDGILEDGNASEETSDICTKCHKKKVERKEAIVELIHTEINYGQDLRILKEIIDVLRRSVKRVKTRRRYLKGTDALDLIVMILKIEQEFYAPIKNGGILSSDHVNAVFLNLQELIDVNSKLCITLQDDLEECITRDDQELESLEVGRAFLENVEFFQAYEVFCSKQRQAAELVESLQKKSELLRIFLQVSCKQNSKLRKMDLKSFLTMPVQRIMKYPLLLTRIYRATLRGNSDREALIQARRKIEEQITKINEIASGRPAKLRKSKSTSALNQSESNGNYVTRLVAEILDWRLEETQIILSDAFEVSCCELINIPNWSRKSLRKPCKVQTILCLYGVLDQLQVESPGDQCRLGSSCEAANAAVIILKKKTAHRYSLFKNPIMLGQAVIAKREDVETAFEISPIARETLTFVAEDAMCCKKWLKSLKYYAKDLGNWRTRRNAMANIMIQSMS